MSLTGAEAAVFRKVRWRLIPFMFVLYVVSYLDRINIGFAALQMNADLGFSASVYGLGAGVFFVSYVALEIPSNMILARVGARLWIARIMISWGLVSSAMMFVQGPFSLYLLRFLLGAAEAGFFPGMILYLTYWFPESERGRAVALFMTATALAGVFGGPISGALLGMGGGGGLAGWQWLFLLEGLPAVVLGLVVLGWLDDGPQTARWLTPDEKRVLLARLEREQRIHQAVAHASVREALTSRSVWRLAAVYFGLVVGLYGISFWMPQILQALSAWTPVQVGFLSAVPYVVAAVGMVWVGRHSDRTGERRWHVASASATGAVGLAVTGLVDGTAASLAALCVAALGIWSALGPFWALPAKMLSGASAAAGIALINSVGNIGGFVGPYLVGFVRDRTASFAMATAVLAALLMASGLLTLAGAAEARRVDVDPT